MQDHASDGSEQPSCLGAWGHEMPRRQEGERERERVVVGDFLPRLERGRGTRAVGKL